MKKPKCDCSGWATRNNLVCGDGRVIRKDAFADCDGTTVPLVWNHQHNDPLNVLGHALLENRQDGVYAYCTFNETESGKAAKLLVQHGDVEALSIYANQLKQQNRDVIHGMIREVSLVVAGANPGAFIDFVDLAHGEGAEQEVIIGTGEGINLAHAEDDKDDDGEDPKDTPDDKKEKPEDDDETVEEVFNSLTDKQKNVVYALIGQALEEGGSEKDDDPEDKSGGKQTAKHSEGGDNTMKHNVFDKPDDNRETVLSHSAQEEIISNAKTKSIGTLQGAMKLYAEQHSDTLKHGIDDIEALFPDYRDLRPGAPEVVSRDQGWVTVVMNKVHKSPISRIRTKQMDARRDGIRAKGYKKGSLKTPSGNMKLITRTTDPQTVYITDAMHRDDKIDITDFDVVEYQYGVMRQTLNEELAVAIMIGDGREEGDEHKIYQEHIRSIWNDDDLYAIHYDVDVAGGGEGGTLLGREGASGQQHLGQLRRELYLRRGCYHRIPVLQRAVQGNRHPGLLLRPPSAQCDAAGPRPERPPHLRLQERSGQSAECQRDLHRRAVRRSGPHGQREQSEEAAGHLREPGRLHHRRYQGRRDHPLQPVRHRLQSGEVHDRDPSVRRADPYPVRYRAGGACGGLTPPWAHFFEWR